MKKIGIILLITTLIGCKTSDNTKSSKRLSDQSLEEFNQIFGDIPFN